MTAQAADRTSADTAVSADQRQDEKLGLHANGEDWQFKRAKGLAENTRVLLIGDSIMNGYRHQVTAQLKKVAKVSFWVTGLHLNSPELHPELKKVLNRDNYDVIHFNIGLHGWVPGRIPKGQYEPLLRTYVETIREHAPHAKLIWASTTPIRLKANTKTLDPLHNKTVVDRNQLAEKVMASEKIPVNDLYALVSGKMQFAAGDPFHWTGPANKLMATQVVKCVGEQLQRPEESE
jgi:lysophospholipase L1-like esterase